MTNTHILLHGFVYLEPASLEEAIALLNRYEGRAQLLAGGTFLLVQIKQEHKAPEAVINISWLPELGGASWKEDQLSIGALTLIRETGRLSVVQSQYQALAEACAAFGSMQIQMMGTIGGNICNGSPASDGVPALMAFDAKLALVGPKGARIVSLPDFLLGPGKTAIKLGEVLTRVLLPRPRPDTGSAFIKITRVQADLAKVSVAAVIARAGDRVLDCKLAFGSVAPTVIRATEAEDFLKGQIFSSELALEAGKLAMRQVSPIDDVRSTAWYRREVVKALTHDVLMAAWERANGQGVAPVTKVGSEAVPDRVLRSETLLVEPDEQALIRLRVNGEEHQVWVAPNELLLNVLREKLEITGPKYGCGIGECGACTVLLDGQPALSCLTLALAADGRQVLTVEGMRADDGTLHPLQDSFLEHQAFQCGYCTPGMLMMSKALLDEIPAPNEDDVREFLRGNRCRCTGFASIVRAVLDCVGN
jgi:carbon-monoxide dehydrogenase medium subunit